MPRNPLEAVEKRLGAFLVERGGMSVPARYGDVRAEQNAARQKVAVFDLCSAGKIAVRGEERVRFLQGLLAQDVAALSPECGFYSLLLSREGRVSGEMRVVATADAALLLTPSLARPKVKGVLERHLAATRASVADETAERALVSVQGPRAVAVVAKVLGAAPPLAPYATATVDTAAFGPVLFVGAPRGSVTGVDLLLPPDLAPPLFEALVGAAKDEGGGPAGLDALEALRVEAGIPAYGADLDETTLPTEIGERPRGVSFDKGCFLGRETLGILRERGRPARRIVGLVFDGSCAPVRGDRLFRNGVPVGSVTSGAYSPALERPIALGMVSYDASRPGTQLLTVDGEKAEVAEVPFVPAAPAS